MRSLEQIPVLPVTGAKPDVRRFAMRVVSQLARTNGIQSGQASPDILELVLRLARTGDPSVFARLQAEMKRRRLSAEHVIDIYFPAAINEIGTDWHEAKISVLDATIAIARLQSMLREFGQTCFADKSESSMGGLVLMVLPPGEQHCLGAMLAAHQLRRLGVSVKLALLASPEALDPLLVDKSYDSVFVSASNDTMIQVCQVLVHKIRARLSRATPIVLGGGLVSRLNCDNDRARLVAASGADLATCDLNVALQSCGINRASVAAE